MYFISFLFINLCITFTCFVTSVPSPQSDDNSKGLSDAELAVIGLSPPNPRMSRTESEEALNPPVLKPQESLTSSYITYDDIEEEQPIETASAEKPFSITFPITRSSKNKQAVQSIVIPLPSDLNDKTGIIVIEDHDYGGGNLDRRTLRAQFFSPTRIKPFTRSQPLREETVERKVRNETESSINRINVFNKKPQNNNKTTKKDTIETKAEPTTTSSVVFDDDIITVTSTFSPESVFRPKSLLSANNKKKNLTTTLKSINPIIDSMTISLKAKQRINKKSKNQKSLAKSAQKSTTTTTTTTTTESPTTTDDYEDFEDIENTESTTFTTPETTTRNTILRQLSPNDRPNVRRRWNHSNSINHTITITTTQRPTTERPTTTEIPTTTTTEPTTTQRITTTQRTTTTERPFSRRRVPRRRTGQRKTTTTTTTTTTTASPTTVVNRRRETTTTSSPIDTTEVDYELINLDNSTQKSFDINSLRISKPTNRTINSDEELKPRPPGIPHIPANFGTLPSGKAFNLPHNVPGSAGLDYPTYDRVPATDFDCKEQMYPGFYADMKTGCQVYHSCNTNLRASKHTFLCPNGTIFSQEYLICDWWYNVNCADSPLYYPLNKEAFSSPSKPNSTQTTKPLKAKNNKKTKPKTTTTEFVIRTITTTDLP